MSKPSTLLPMLIICSLFFVFGFVTWLNGSLIPFLQIACELTHFEAYFVTLSFYIAYTVFAIPATWLLRRTGYRRGLALGLLVMALGALVFIPAALMREYSIFLTALFVLGAGLTLLQTASNPYIVVIGPRETAAVRVSILGVVNKTAGVLAPIAFSILALNDMGQFNEASLAELAGVDRTLMLNSLSERLVMPYVWLFAALLVLTAAVFVSPLPEPPTDPKSDATDIRLTALVKHPRLILGAVTLFAYVGVEVIAGDTIGLFGKSLGVADFGTLTSYTMIFMVTGYVLGIVLIPRFVGQARALQVSACLGIVLSIAIVLLPDVTSYAIAAPQRLLGLVPVPDVVVLVALLGLANALVWPAVWPLALEGLSIAEISAGAALLVMGIAGGAILPLVYGLLSDLWVSEQVAYIVLLPCYSMILFFALKGHKMVTWTNKASPK